MPCDRRVSGAAAPTAAGGRRRKVMQARNREFRRLNAEREGGRLDFEVGKAGSNPASAIKKRDTRENLVSFFLCPATEKAVLHTDWAQVRQNKARRKYGIRPFITISAKQERSSLLFMLKSNKNLEPVSLWVPNLRRRGKGHNVSLSNPFPTSRKRHG